VAPKELRRFNQLRSATIQANLAPGYTLGEALSVLQATPTRSCRRPRSPTIPARAASSQSASSIILFVFVLALAFIYLVLAAQFESFVDPLMIMLTVPLSMTGALRARSSSPAARSTSTGRSA
jgi:multidrug efflux pump